MDLKFSGQFNRDIDIGNKQVLKNIYNAILNVKNAQEISSIHEIKKLREYSVHYRIRLPSNYRIGVIIRKNTVWFMRFGHRSVFYKRFP